MLQWNDLPQEYLWPVSLISYIAWGLALFMIAKKTKTPNAWLAWIPLLNLLLLVDIADVGCLWLLLLLIPCVNIVVAVWIWWRICEKRGVPGILSVLMLIPGVNVLMALYLGLS